MAFYVYSTLNDDSKAEFSMVQAQGLHLRQEKESYEGYEMLPFPLRRGDPAMRSCCTGTHTKVCSHGVPSTCQSVCETVETNLVMDSSHHIATEIGN